MLLFCCFSFNTFAAGDGEVIGAKVSGVAGSTIELPIKYLGNPGFWIMFLEINFDPEIFEYAGIDDGDYDRAEIVPQTYVNKGKVLLDIEGKDFADLTGDGVIATLKLAVKDTVKVGNYEVNLSIGDGMAVNFEVDYVTPKITSGSVYISCTEHKFKDNTCENCGVIKAGEDIKVDYEKLPEPIKPVIKDVDGSEIKPDDTVTTDNNASNTTSDNTSQSDSVEKDDAQKNEGNNENTPNKSDKPNAVTLIVICVVALLIICVSVIVFVKNKKNKIS